MQIVHETVWQTSLAGGWQTTRTVREHGGAFCNPLDACRLAALAQIENTGVSPRRRFETTETGVTIQWMRDPAEFGGAISACRIDTFEPLDPVLREETARCAGCGKRWIEGELDPIRWNQPELMAIAGAEGLGACPACSTICYPLEHEIDTVIYVQGGCVAWVASNVPDQRIVVIDADGNGPTAYRAYVETQGRLEDMDEDLRNLVRYRFEQPELAASSPTCVLCGEKGIVNEFGACAPCHAWKTTEDGGWE